MKPVGKNSRWWQCLEVYLTLEPTRAGHQLLPYLAGMFPEALGPPIGEANCGAANDFSSKTCEGAASVAPGLSGCGHRWFLSRWCSAKFCCKLQTKLLRLRLFDCRGPHAIRATQGAPFRDKGASEARSLMAVEAKLQQISGWYDYDFMVWG